MEEVPDEQNYVNELLSVSGVGKKTMKDIIAVYPTKDSLNLAISSKNHIPARDDIVEKLKERFG